MSHWAGRTVLVTAANGFTGSHLCRELLQAGATVRGLVRSGSSLENLEDLRDRMELVTGDVTDFPSVLAACRGVTDVCHAAALVSVVEAQAGPPAAFQVNAIGAYYAARAALQSGATRFLHISTCYVYGNLPDAEFPVKETAVPRPTDVYAVSKFAGEALVRSVAAQGLPVIIARAFSKYGPGQLTKFFIPNVIAQMLQGAEVRLGDPRPTRDFTYITDIARGYRLMLERGRSGEIYHLSDGAERTVGSVCDLIVRLCGGTGRVVWNHTARPNDVMRQGGDSTKAHRELGWTPTIDLETGLRRTVEWWRERLARQPAVAGGSRGR